MPSSTKAKNSRSKIQNSSSSSSSDGRRETPKKTSNTKSSKNRSPSSPSSVKETKTRKMPTIKPSPKTMESSKTKATETPVKTSPRAVENPASLGFDEYVSIKTSMTELRNTLPLDFSETPMTPDTIDTRYGSNKANVVGLNILLQDEKKLTIPKSLKSTLQSLFVTSSRLSGHIKLTDVSVLAECPNLRELSLSRCHILSNVDSLSSLPNLEVVDLSHCSAIESLNLEKSVNLESLNFSHCTKLKDLTSLNGSSRLKKLNLSHCTSLTTLPLLGVNNLEVLDVSHCTSLENTLTTFHLTELNIHGSGLEKDFAPRILPTDSFRVGSWNLLAKGLEIDGFLTQRGWSDVEWTSRGEKVANVLSNMLQVNDVVVTQENDNFFWLLEKLRKINPNVRGLWCCKTLPSRTKGGDFVASNARSFLIKRMIQSFMADNLVLDDNLTKVNELLALKPKEFAPRCSELYNIVNKINLTVKRFPTFMQVSNIYNSFCEFYGLGPDDTYISDDGIGIYYDSSRASLVHLCMGLFRTFQENKYSRYGMVNDTPVLWNKDGWVDATFQLEKAERMVTVYGAHLPSGEDEAAEKERYSIVKSMIDTIITEVDDPIPVVFAMDSNVSPEYEAGFKNVTLMSSLYKLAGYEDSILPGTFPCFKMRGPGSDQPKKIGELFVDQIDKILYNTTMMSVLTREHPLDEYGFHRLSRQAYDEVYPIRTNPELREKNNKTVRNGGRDAVVMDIYPDPGSAFLEIYPGPNSPSDHPPVSSEFLFVPTFQRPVPEMKTTPEPEMKTKSKKTTTPEPTPKSKRDITPEPEMKTKPKKTVTPVQESSSESEPKIKTKRTVTPEAKPKSPKWSREKIESGLLSAIRNHYTTARKELGLKEYSVDEVDKLLEKSDENRKFNEKITKLVNGMFDGTKEKDFSSYENEDFTEWLTANKLLPDWTEEAKKSKKSPKTQKWTEESLRTRLEEVFKAKDKAKYKKAIADEKSVKMLEKLTRQMVKDMQKENYTNYRDSDFEEYLMAGKLLPEED
jgi:hypothetical protein